MSNITRKTDDKGRFYFINDVDYKSVTTVLDAAQLAYGLKEYFLNTTKAEAEKKLKDAGLQGSKIHHSIDAIINHEIILPKGITIKQIENMLLEMSEEYRDKELVEYLLKPFTETEDTMMRGFMQWCEDFKPVLIDNEVIVWRGKPTDPLRYAGTTDFIGYVFVDKKNLDKGFLKPGEFKLHVIIDWKTGKAMYPTYHYQVAAYAYAYAEKKKSEKKNKLPKACALLHLGMNNNGYRFSLVKNMKKAFDAFQKINAAWVVQNEGAGPRTYQFASEYRANIERVKKQSYKVKIAKEQKSSKKDEQTKIIRRTTRKPRKEKSADGV